MLREQIAQFAQCCGDVEALLGQRLSGNDARQRRRRIGFAGQQHIGTPLLHVPDETVARAARHHDFHAVERMRAVVAEVMRQLIVA